MVNYCQLDISSTKNARNKQDRNSQIDSWMI